MNNQPEPGTVADASAVVQTESPTKLPVVWFELHVENMDRAIKFYRDLLGWECSPHHTDADEREAWTIDTGSSSIGGTFIKSSSELRGNRTVLYVQVDEVDSSAKRAVMLGASLEREKSQINAVAGSAAIIRDPDGNAIGLWQP